MTKQNYLLVLLAVLAGARFIIVPLYDQQAEMLQSLQLTSQQLEKANRLVANKLSLEQGMAQLQLNLAELTALFPAPATASQFRLSVQQQLQQQFTSQNVQVTVFDWVSQSDANAGDIEVHTARLIVQGAAPLVMKAFTDYFSVLPYARVTELTVESRIVSALSEDAATVPVSAVVVIEFSRLGSVSEP